MPFSRLAATPPLRATTPPGQVARVVGEVFGAPLRVLPRAAGPWLTPALSPRLAASPGLLTLIRALNGRLTVTNPGAVVRLPWAVGLLAQAALRRVLAPADAELPDLRAADPADDLVPGTRDARERADRRRLRALAARLPDAASALAPGARWARAALYEPADLVVRFGDEGTLPPEPEPVPARAQLRYRLVLTIGRDADAAGAPGAAVEDEAARAAPAMPWPPGRHEGAPWFVRRLLLPDAMAAAHMGAATLARWATLTGRAGAARDRYWFTESWERYREPGRLVGHVAPDAIARQRRRTPVLRDAATSLAGALDASVDRGVCVPPGYCLVDCVGTLEVAVVVH